MLKGISPLFSPELLATLYRMGHGDELVLADAHFPGERLNPRIIRADGLRIDALLDAILPLLELDPFGPDPLVMMSVVPGDQGDPAVAAGYRAILARHSTEPPTISELERFSFYERAARAFAVVMTGDTRKYGNLILTKGVTPG